MTPSLRVIETLIILYKNTQQEITRLEERLSPIFGTVEIDELQKIMDNIELQIRLECGMPLEEELGVFAFDIWTNFLFGYIDGEYPLYFVTLAFLNWDKNPSEWGS
jgi:hypothetical protein